MVITPKEHPVVVVTGAAGFLGSALTVDLSRDHNVLAIDLRAPSQALRQAAPGVDWRQADICDRTALATAFGQTRRRFGRIDFVLHFAAFYHFGADWRPEYQRTNIDGTSIVLDVASQNDVGRVFFGSSMVAMLPPPQGQMLTEQSPTAEYVPYGKSKSLGEAMVKEKASSLPATVLRIAGVFSDWCELPPLDSMIRLWMGNWPSNRIIVGRGETGIPYIHREDLVQLVRCCIARDAEMGPLEVFLASQHGAVSHNELFQWVHSARRQHAAVRPISLPASVAAFALPIRRAMGRLTRNPPYERAWMLQFIDRPWVADTTYTRNRLQWDCTSGRQLCDRLPTMIHRFLHNRREWDQRSQARKEAKYSYMMEQRAADG